MGDFLFLKHSKEVTLRVQQLFVVTKYGKYKTVQGQNPKPEKVEKTEVY